MPVLGAPHKPAAALAAAAFSETRGTALRASHPGGTWFESSAAHHNTMECSSARQ